MEQPAPELTATVFPSGDMIEVGRIVRQRKSPADPQRIQRQAHQLPWLTAQNIESVAGRRKPHFERRRSHLQLARKGEIAGADLVDRAVVGGQRVYPRVPLIRRHCRRRPVDPDVTRHREHFQIHRRDRATLLVRDEGVTRKSRGSVVAAAGAQNPRPNLPWRMCAG